MDFNAHAVEIGSILCCAVREGGDARAGISVPKEVKLGGVESSWVANRINLSAVCPHDADGHEVEVEVRTREEFVARGCCSKLKAESRSLTWCQPAPRVTSCLHLQI